jgi:alpha-L-fucosidase
MKSGQFMVRYDVLDYVDRKSAGQAVIEAFFTAKGDDLYAIVPGWPGKKLVIKDAHANRGTKVKLLGGGELSSSASGKDLSIELPELSADAARAQHAYVLQITGLTKP